MCVCVCVCVCVFMCMSLGVCVCVYVDVLRGVCVCLCVFMCMSLGVRVCLCVCPVTPEGRPQPYGHYGPAQDLAVWLPSITANAHTSIEVMNRAPAE